MIKADYHVHTGYCPHASGTITDYIEIAIKKGIQEIGFCDHLPVIKNFQEDYTMKEDELPKYVEEIFALRNTYKDDITPEGQAEVVMENYDPEFGKIVKNGDLLVGGYNFGTGSSREQAATALKYRGIQLVIAGSAGATYMRNALNNGFLVLEIPVCISLSLVATKFED